MLGSAHQCQKLIRVRPTLSRRVTSSIAALVSATSFATIASACVLQALVTEMVCAVRAAAGATAKLQDLAGFGKSLGEGPLWLNFDFVVHLYWITCQPRCAFSHDHRFTGLSTAASQEGPLNVSVAGACARRGSAARGTSVCWTTTSSPAWCLWTSVTQGFQVIMETLVRRSRSVVGVRGPTAWRWVRFAPSNT